MESELFHDTQRKAFWELVVPLVRPAVPWPPISHHINWPAVEDDLGVTLPVSFKSVSNILPAGFLGTGITWTSPLTDNLDFRLDRQQLSARANIGFTPDSPLYPAVPGYLIFAPTSMRIDLAYRVERGQGGLLCCDPCVTLIECVTGEQERTSVEVDELLYRSITNKPRLLGTWSSALHNWFFADSSLPIFRPL